MTTLEHVALLGTLILVAVEPVRRTREWWARTRAVAPDAARFRAAREHYETIR